MNDDVHRGTALVAHKERCGLYSRGTRRTFLLVLFLVGASSYIDKNIIGALLEPIKAEFKVTDSMLGLLSGISFALFYATVGIPVARWADRSDRKRIITVSLLAWSVMTALCGIAHSFWQLVVARFGVGAGEAGAVPPAQSLLADYYPPAERAGAIGVFMMSSAAGNAIGLILGGFIAQNYGWRAAFITVGLLGISLTPVTHFVLKEPRALKKVALQTNTQESIQATIGALLGKPAYRNLLWAIVVFFLMGYGAIVFVVSLMIRLHGLNVAQAGALFGVISAIGAIVGNLAGGVLADKLAKRDLALMPRLAGWAMIAAVPAYELAFAAPGLALMAPLLLLAMTVGNAVLPPAFATLHVVCGTKRRAMAIALVLFFANLIGLGLGPVVTGSLSDMLSGVYGPAEGLRNSLMIMMVVLVLAGWLMLRVGRHTTRDVED